MHPTALFVGGQRDLSNVRVVYLRLVGLPNEMETTSLGLVSVPLSTLARGNIHHAITGTSSTFEIS